jgi:hypothetical protein
LGLELQPLDCALLDLSATEVIVHEIAGNPEQPAPSILERVAAKARSARDRFRKRLTHQIESDLWVYRPAREIAQQILCIVVVETRHVVIRKFQFDCARLDLARARRL